MSNTDKDATFETQIRNTLDEQLLQIDTASQARLRQARLKAVAEAESRQHQPHQWWIPAMGVAATLIVGVTVVLFTPRSEVSADLLLAQTDYTEDVEMLSAKDELEFYDDFEFLLWLDQTEQES